MIRLHAELCKSKKIIDFQSIAEYVVYTEKQTSILTMPLIVQMKHLLIRQKAAILSPLATKV